MLQLHQLKRCDIRFEFDNEGIFNTGDTVSGVVIVTAKKDMVCENLSIQYCWATYGKGSQNSGEWQQKTFEIIHKKLLVNESQRIPFSFQAPESPITYQGYILNIKWHIKATLKSKGFFDSAHSDKFILMPKSLDTTYVTSYGQRSSVTEERWGKLFFSVLPYVLFGIAFYIFGGLLLGLILQAVNLPLSLIMPTLTIIYVLYVISLNQKKFRLMLLSQKLRPTKIQLSNNDLLPNETFTCHLSFRPVTKLMRGKIIFRLKAIECTQSGVDSREVHLHELFYEEHVQTTVFETGTIVQLEQYFQVPPDALYSFFADNNSLEWNCEVAIEIKGWPNWTRKIPLEVVPWRRPEVLDSVEANSNRSI